MRIKFRQPKEITTALETLVPLCYVTDVNGDCDFLDEDGKTVSLSNLIHAAEELDLSRDERKALDVLESAYYNGRGEISQS